MPFEATFFFVTIKIFVQDRLCGRVLARWELIWYSSGNHSMLFKNNVFQLSTTVTPPSPLLISEPGSPSKGSIHLFYWEQANMSALLRSCMTSTVCLPATVRIVTMYHA